MHSHGKYKIVFPETTKTWEAHYKDKGYFVKTLDSRVNTGMNQVTSIVLEACKEKLERDRRKGILNRPIRAMIVGIPNVGKSTFINSYAKKACTKVGNKPGVTKGKQWIRISKDIELLDTPGILWPKFEDKEVGIKLAFIGTINDDIILKSELAVLLIDYLKKRYPKKLIERYACNVDVDNYELLKQIAIVRQCKNKGNEIDCERASNIFIDEFRTGKIGRISMESPK